MEGIGASPYAALAAEEKPSTADLPPMASDLYEASIDAEFTRHSSGVIHPFDTPHIMSRNAVVIDT